MPRLILAFVALLIPACTVDRQLEEHLVAVEDATDAAWPEEVGMADMAQIGRSCLRFVGEPSIELIGLQNTTVTESVTLENCGDVRLVLRGFFGLPGSGGLGVGDIFVPELEVVLAPGEALNQEFGFIAGQLGQQTLRYAVAFGVEGAPPETWSQLELDVVVGSLPDEPEPEPDGCVDIYPEVSDEPETEPWDGVLLTDRSRAYLRVGVGSSPPGVELAAVEWSLVAAPQGALSPFATPPSQDPADDAMVELWHVGEYVLEVTGTDSRGVPVCAPVRAEIKAVAPAGLYVELAWTTLSDPDPTDTCAECAPDLDLHLLSPAPGSQWTERRNNGTEGDCHNQNPNPDWGVYGDEADDPQLLRDGPAEAISIAEPAPTIGRFGGYDAPYQIGVYFFDVHAFSPPVFAQVRVFTEGGLVPTAMWPTDSARGRTLFHADSGVERNGDVWLPGTVDWTPSGASLTEVDTLHTGFPAN